MPKKQKVDLCYVIDCTGSMWSYIKKAKDTIKEVLAKVNEDYPNVEFRVACVAFRDWSDGAKRLESQDFTDVNTCKTFIGNLKATGGGDQCEDVFGGLMKATELNWISSTTRIVFCVCDAPQHGKQYYDKAGDSWPDGHPDDPKPDYHKSVVSAYKNKCIKLFFSKCNNSVDKMIKVLQNAADSDDLCIQERDLTKIDKFLNIVVEVIKYAIKLSEKKNDDKDELPVVGESTTINKFIRFVGIDFGTDGTAWCFSSDGSQYYLSDKGIHGCKDKTNILLNKSYKAVAFGRKAQEMYLDNPKYKDYYYFERFKMALYDKEMLKYDKIKDKDTDIKEDEKEDKFDDCESSETSYLIAANGTPVKTHIVFTQAFIYLKKEILKYFKGKGLITNRSEIKWIITVPAIWSQGAKNLMHKAANDSGMVLNTIPNHMEIALEPECASITLREKAKLKIGSKYVLLDLGGGTADICCHQVCKNENVKQIRHPSGGKWGATYIDEEFINLISEIFKLGSKNIINEFMIENPIKLLQFKEQFRKAKHSFKETENKHLKIEMSEALETFILEKHSLNTSKEPGSTPDEGDSDDSGDDSEDSDDDENNASTKINELITQKIENGLSDKYIKLKRGDIEYKDGCLCIDPYVMKILFNTVLIKHVDNEVLKHKNVRDCKTIFLAGGLSSSSYVKNIITKHYKQMKINIFSIDRPFVAVVEGAVKFGLNPSSIVEYYSEYSYGIRICRDFDPETDENERKIWTDDGHVVFNAFKRLVKCGPININDPDPIEYFAPLNAHDKHIEITIYRTKKEDILFTHDKNGKLLPNVEQLNDPKMFELKDWDSTKSFPIRFDFKKDIRAEVGLRDYPEAERFIELPCKLSSDE